jgi:hypothetical protein
MGNNHKRNTYFSFINFRLHNRSVVKKHNKSFEEMWGRRVKSFDI